MIWHVLFAEKKFEGVPMFGSDPGTILTSVIGFVLCYT